MKKYVSFFISYFVIIFFHVKEAHPTRLLMGRMRFHNLCNFGITLPDNIYKVTYSNWGDDNFVSSPQFHISLDLGYSLFVSGALIVIKDKVE